MNRRREKSIIALLLVVVFISGLFTVSSADKTTPDQKINIFEQKLDKNMPKLLDKYNVPGVTTAIIHNGDIVWKKGYGTKNKSTEAPMTTDTVFQAASISKSLTAWGVMKLVEQGKIDLDAPVEKYLTRWHLPKSQYIDKVTIRRILSHTAGLNVRSYIGHSTDEQPLTLEEALSQTTNTGERLAVTNKPGENFLYSGGGYTLLQLVIEEVTGTSFSQYMENEVLKPLGMESSSYEWNDALRLRTSYAYNAMGWKMPNYMYSEKAAAGLYTTVEDLAKFASAAMDSPKGDTAGRGVLSKDTIALMTTPMSIEKGKSNYGLGYNSFMAPGEKRIITHNGTNRGWCAQYYFNPETRDGFVIMTNSDMGNCLIDNASIWWVEMETGQTPDFYIQQGKTEIYLTILAAVLFILLIAYWIRIILQLRVSKRVWFVKASLKRPWLKIVLLLLTIILAIVLWYLCYVPWYQGAWSITPYLPAGVQSVVKAVMAWLVLLGAAGLFPKLRTEKMKTRKNKAAEV